MISTMKINWKRLAWLIFIYLYAGLFFYNCLRPFNYWFVSYVYTIILILWLGVEYYQKHLFFQSGLIPYESYNVPLRVFFALFFYSSFVVGISTIVWWYKNQIGLYPFIQIIGVAILIYSIFLRWQAMGSKNINAKVIYKFYLSIMLLAVSLILGYGSLFLIIYAILVGSLLVFLQYRFEEKIFRGFEDFVYNKQKINKIEVKDYEELWSKYAEKNSAKQ